MRITSLASTRGKALNGRLAAVVGDLSPRMPYDEKEREYNAACKTWRSVRLKATRLRGRRSPALHCTDG